MPPTDPSANHSNASITRDEAIISCFRSDPYGDSHLLERLNIEQMFILIDGVLPIEACLYYQVLPLFLDGSRLNLGMVCPDDISASDYVRRIVSYLNYSLVTRQISSEALQVSLSAYLRYADRKSALAPPVEPSPASRRAKRLSDRDRPSRNIDAASQPTLVVDSPDNLDTPPPSADARSSSEEETSSSDEAADTVQLFNEEEVNASETSDDDSPFNVAFGEAFIEQDSLEHSWLEDLEEDAYLEEQLETSALSDLIEETDNPELHLFKNDASDEPVEEYLEDEQLEDEDLASNEASDDISDILLDGLAEDGEESVLEEGTAEPAIAYQAEDLVTVTSSLDEFDEPQSLGSNAAPDRLEIPPIPLDAIDDTLTSELEDFGSTVEDQSSTGNAEVDAEATPDADTDAASAEADRLDETAPLDNPSLEHLEDPLPGEASRSFLQLPLNLDLDESLAEVSLKEMPDLPPAELLQGLLARVLEGGIGRLFFEHRPAGGRILWSENGVLQSVIDEVPPLTFKHLIEELKQLTQVPLVVTDKATQIELERIYRDERILMRFRFIQTEYGEDATLQVLRGAALRFYQQQQLSRLGRDALSIATTLQQKIKEIGDRTRQLTDFPAQQPQMLPTLTQLLAKIEAELNEIQKTAQRD